MTARALVLDGHLRHALAIVRSLGRSGIPVIAASSHRHFPAAASRHAAARALLPADAGPQELLAVVRAHDVEVVIAAGLAGNELLCRHREILEPHVRAAYNPLATFELLGDKFATAQLADRLGVRRPATIQLRGEDDLATAVAELPFPLVFKSPVDQGTVRYARDAAALEQLAAAFRRDHPDLIERGAHPLVQELVEGDGHGFYALAENGQLLAYFMHRRLHEVPPSGGPSAMAMSWRDAELLELGARFVRETAWNGVAMVEFKRSRRNGELYLLEVNPKFWGSLDLSIHAGVDFPLLLYRMLCGLPLQAQPGAYRDRDIYRWLTMDLAYAAQARRLRGYVRSFADPRIADDLDWHDLRPTGMLFATGVTRFAASLRDRSGGGSPSPGR